MLIAAFDTSGRDGSLALARAEANTFEVLSFTTIAGGTYSAEIIPLLSSALEKAGLKASDIGLLAVASGPGSFTGLRVGLGTVKGLAEAMGTPIVAVSVLEAVAFASKREGLVLAALDAQRNEVFVGEYEMAAGSLKLVHESLATAADFTTWLSARIPVPVTCTPDASIEKKVREAGSPAELVARPAADAYARIAARKFAAGETITPEALDANYIRRSDAEIFSAPKGR